MGGIREIGFLRLKRNSTRMTRIRQIFTDSFIRVLFTPTKKHLQITAICDIVKISMKIRDLIDTPPVKTVIQLEDVRLQEQGVLEELLTSFVFTEEVGFNLAVLFDALNKSTGTGCFLKGNYGSGKSHFLAVLAILLEHMPSVDKKVASEYLLKEKRFLTVKIPLVRYPSSLKLEEIILFSIEQELSQKTSSPVILANHNRLITDFNKYILPQHPEFLKVRTQPQWEELIQNDSLTAAREIVNYLNTLETVPLRYHYDREDAFEKIKAELKGDGLVLLIDELSEFLKAKPGTASFNEDVRYLQYLGERATQEPLWIIASLQEGIEEIGYLEEALFNRIKDRYPKRLTLSSRHIEELIEKRLIIKKQGASAHISQVYTYFTHTFPHLILDKEKFIQLYPLHPSTIRMLEGLSLLFSQHRGVVDYIHYQVAGDPSRQIEGMLDKPIETLLTPETIFDHFAHRIKETVEIAPYYNVAFSYFQRELPELFKKEFDQNIALKLVKLLILTELSPLEKRHTIRELTNMLVQKVTDIESGLNYDYIKEAILDRLLLESAYIKSEPAQNPLETIYYLDLEANINQLIARYTKEIIKELRTKEQSYLELLKVINPSYLPLAGLAEGRQKRFIRWENTSREGVIILRDLRYISLGEMELLHQSLLQQETDFALLMGLPVFVDEQKEYMTKLLSYQPMDVFSQNIVVWLPTYLTPQDEDYCFTTYSHQTLLQRCQNNDPHQILPVLSKIVEKELPRVREILTEVYFGGSLFNVQGETRTSLKDLGYPAFEHLLKTIFSPLLSFCYPKHTEIMPYTDYITQHTVETLWTEFIIAEKITLKQAQDKDVQNSIETVVIPLGLAKKTANYFSLNVEPTKNELITDYLAHLLPGKRIKLENLYWRLRKSPWGIDRHRFNLLTSCLIHTGYLTPYKEGRISPFPSPAKLYSFGLDELGEGKLLEKEYIELLPLGNFIWGEMNITPFTLITQRQLWDEALKFKSKTDISQLAKVYTRFSDYSAFQSLKVDEITKIISSIEGFLDEIKTSYDSKNGLERILYYLQEHNEINKDYTAFQNLLTFFSQYAQEYNRIYNYIHHSQLFIPANEKFEYLRQKKDKIDLTNLSKIIFNGEFEDVQSDYGAFVTAFVEVYSQHHQDYYAQGYFSQIKGFRQELEYNLLERLSKLNLISVENDLVLIERMLSPGQMECKKRLNEELELKPICSCQYRLGQEGCFPNLKEVRVKIRSGIVEYIQALKEPGIRGPLESHIRGLSELGRQEAEDLKKLIQLDITNQERLITQLRYLLTDNLVVQLNQALEGRQLIVKRNLEDLIDRIEKRKFPKAKLRKCFEDWLDGGEKLAEEVYIAVNSRKTDFQYAGLQEIIKEEDDRFLAGFWAICALAQHKTVEELKQSLFLRTAYQIDVYRLDEVIHKGAELKKQPQITNQLEAAEQKIKDQNQTEQFLKELNLVTRTTEELLQIIAREGIFQFVSNEAVRLLLTHLLTEEGRQQPLNIECPRPDWETHIQMANDLSNLLTRMESYPSEMDIFNAYIDHISPVNFLIERLASNNFREGILLDNTLKELRQNVHQLTKGYQQRFSEELSRHKHWTTADFLKRIFNPTWAKYPQATCFILILDGGRWDIVEYLLPVLKACLPNHELSSITPLEALEPTTTEINRQALVGTLLEEEEKVAFYTYGEGINKREEIGQALIDEKPIKVLNFNFIDSRLHTAVLELPVFYEELALELKANILPYFKNLPTQSLIFMLSDHGFLYQPSKKEPYTHGGASAFEKIIPCEVWLPKVTADNCRVEQWRSEVFGARIY
ncbi:MAG: DUF6079 family protein [bacterium]|nr:DUF6079 family protein [bacterium]